MSRIHYMQDRVRIRRRRKHVERGIVENVNRGIVEESPEHKDERDPVGGWIPARIRNPESFEDRTQEVKIDLPHEYELVMYAWDEDGNEICPLQHDQLQIKYRRDGDLVDTTAEARITGIIKEVRKRNRLYSYVMPIVLDTEF